MKLLAGFGSILGGDGGFMSLTVGADDWRNVGADWTFSWNFEAMDIPFGPFLNLGCLLVLAYRLLKI